MGNKRNYGLPYMGSKSKIINFICDSIPSCDTFVDLFCGGGSVTHYMVENNRYNHYICNDKNHLIVDLLDKTLRGEYRNERRFIDREEFLREKNNDGYIRYIWSFGNRGTSYLYSSKMEDYKRCLHNAIYNDEFDELKNKYCIDLSEIGVIDSNDIRSRVNMTRKIMKRMSLDNVLIHNNGSYKYSDDAFIDNEHVNRIRSTRINDIEHFERLELMSKLQEHIEHSRLQHIENVNRLNEVMFDNELIEFSSLSYQDVVIPDNSVIYCDIPYKDTGTYTSGKFDYEAFYEYALKSDHPIFISEYEMPNDFICVDEIDKKCQFKNSVGAIDTTERLYTTLKSLQIINDNPEIFSWNFKNGL